MENKYTVTLIEDSETKDLIMPFPEGMCDDLGWEIGDSLNWTQLPNGTLSLTKIDTDWVLVDCVSTYRMRYMVQVPKGKSEWALDTVTMEEAKEFSQEHIGEQIVSHRVVTKKEALKLCDQDNDYGSSWDKETKMKNFFTTWEEQNGNN